LKRAHGFTLIELLVVFGILAAIIGIVPPAMGKLRDAVAYRQTVQDVTALLRKARQQATLQGMPVAFAFNTANHQYGIAGQASAKVPDGLKVQLVTAAGAALADGSQTIVFLPEGGATGGSISLIRGESGGGVRLRVDWLSGQVTKETL